jgi:hypothetical protein
MIVYIVLNSIFWVMIEKQSIFCDSGFESDFAFYDAFESTFPTKGFKILFKVEIKTESYS